MCLSFILSTTAKADKIHNPTIEIAAGYSHSLVLKENGTAWAWGSNEIYQLGDGTTTDRSVPSQITGLNHIKHVDEGVALKNDGTVWTWGYQTTPIQTSGLNDVISIESGASHHIALKSDGTVWAWGSNYDGQLGDGTTTE
ncbi:MAG: Regulator of chromosome condensation, RCC1 [Candidatus Magnetoglobus multicellularis str. Araruama]|uniref:Regulator of chromosome condensation, RCC1 n=1 Tax=Candidatus Magnetoglobus multicellularis str. Araruama TaxID=890399 RepID=A0A1V1PC44_9BACT|nr:MAG: Regulator of chromosome condensation, RCC1 [Candidatus Magnetoglobus multicellularis str. Araruama]